MDNIIEPTIDYDFSKLFLGPPSTLSGGAYFTRILTGSNKPLYIQTPKSLSKQGFVKSGKKIYIDLMYDNNDTIFINWIENLEAKCQELIYAKSASWFETKLEKDDIESAFTSPFKIFKSGKYYLLRVNVKPNIRIEDENDQIMQIDSITDKNTLISIIEVQGIKFTSRNFQIELELKQAAVVSPDPFLDICFIKKPVKKQIDDNINTPLKQEEPITTDIKEFIQESAKDILENTLEDKPLNEPIQQEKQQEEQISNIVLDIEELNFPEKEEEKNEELAEFDLSNTLENSLETMTLKKPNQVYYEIYKKAREKAKQLKKEAVLAYLEMKNIKKTYMLDDMDDSDSEFEGINSDLEEEDLE
jgi:rRNA-processing protein FCF1